MLKQYKSVGIKDLLLLRSLYQVTDLGGVFEFMTTKSKVAGAFIGLAIGDALGVPAEDRDRETFSVITTMIGGGRHNLPVGAWTDKTSAAICLAKSLLATHDLDVYDFMERLRSWVHTGENSSTGVCIGLDENTHNVIENYTRTGSIELNLVDQRSDEDSTLARCAPIACIHWDDLGAVSRISKQQSYLTQGSEVSASACEYLSLVLSHLIAGRAWDFIRNIPIGVDWSPKVKLIAGYGWKDKTIQDMKSSRLACDTLEASLWCVETSDSFEQALIKAVNLVDPSDTLGAVTGQIAGALYGLESIPIHWFDQLAHIEKLTDIALQMVELSRTE